MSFTHILNLSLSASWLVLAIAGLRLLLKRAPKALHCALWALVAIRLLCPVSLQSELSLIPSREIIPTQYLTAEPSGQLPMDTPADLELITNPIYDTSITLDTDTTIDRLQHWDLFATIFWLGGMGAMAIYALYSYLSLRLRVRMAGWVSGNIYECDEIDTPFILGLLRPRIYLPSGLDDVTKSHVLAHETAHLKRLDHLWKPLGFFLLTIHWFNPVMWLGYCLLCRDIELACDEKVIQNLDKKSVRSYSEALVACTVSQRSIALCPLAFGEIGVKGRIRAMLHYKKPGFRVLILAITAAVTLAVCFLTDPLPPVNSLDKILSQENCMVLDLQEKTIKLEIPKDSLPENVLNGKTHPFNDAPILLLAYDNTRLSITKARMSGDELLVTIHVSHDFPDTGSILLPCHPFDDGAEMCVHAAHADVTDAVTWYGNALTVREMGHSSFSVGIKMEVWNQAQDYVRFQLEGLYNLRYSFEPQPVVVDTHTIYTMEGAELMGPRFRLDPDGTFTFSENPLTSYLGFGSYVLSNNRLVMKTDDGRCTWIFDGKDGDFFFDAEHSSIVQWYPDLKTLQSLPDGARFIQSPVYASEVQILLDTICSSPLPSSNPGDYIREHIAEYNQLLERPLETVSYCFGQFAKGHQTDLRGHIMALACKEIIGTTENLSTDAIHMTGQDWFDDFADYALNLREQIGTEELAKFHPWLAMALEILGI